MISAGTSDVLEATQQRLDQANKELDKLVGVRTRQIQRKLKIQKAFFGPITPQVPASVLQLHNDVTLVADEAALSKLSE